MKPKPFTTNSSKIVWSCPWYNIRQDHFTNSHGTQGVYNIIQKEPAVWILPVTTNNQIVLIKSYRYTIDNYCWEIPAGSIKPGQTKEEAATEELHEEIGGITQNLHYIGMSYTANGICNEKGHFFLATDVTLGQTAHEPHEIIEIYKKPIPQVLHMARTLQITDGPSAFLILLCEEKLRKIVRD